MGGLAVVPAVDQVAVDVAGEAGGLAEVLEVFGAAHEPVVDEHVAAATEVVEGIGEGHPEPQFVCALHALFSIKNKWVVTRISD